MKFIDFTKFGNLKVEGMTIFPQELRKVEKFQLTEESRRIVKSFLQEQLEEGKLIIRTEPVIVDEDNQRKILYEVGKIFEEQLNTNPNFEELNQFPYANKLCLGAQKDEYGIWSDDLTKNPVRLIKIKSNTILIEFIDNWRIKRRVELPTDYFDINWRKYNEMACLQE